MAVITDFRTYLKSYYDQWALAVGQNYKDAEIKKETLDKLYGLHNLFMLAGRDGEYATALTFYQSMLTLLGVDASDDAWLITSANLTTLFGTSTAVTIPQDGIFDWDDVTGMYKPYAAKGTGGEFYDGFTAPTETETRINYNGVFASTASWLPRYPAAMTLGDGVKWNDFDHQCMTEYVAGIHQYATNVLFVQTANNVIANTTTETSCFGTGAGSRTLPANFLVPGKTLQFRIRGILSGTNGDTATVRIKVGATTLIASIGAMPSTFTNAEFEADFLFTCRTAGVTGTVIGQGDTKIIVTAGVSTASNRQLLMTSAAVVNTTVSNALDVTYQWSAARAGNSLAVTNSLLRVEM